jgi:hypothetical protein
MLWIQRKRMQAVLRRSCYTCRAITSVDRCNRMRQQGLSDTRASRPGSHSPRSVTAERSVPADLILAIQLQGKQAKSAWNKLSDLQAELHVLLSRARCLGIQPIEPVFLSWIIAASELPCNVGSRLTNQAHRQAQSLLARVGLSRDNLAAGKSACTSCHEMDSSWTSPGCGTSHVASEEIGR